MDEFKLGNKEFNSRLLLGTGKFSSPEVMKESLVSAACEIVTTAVRRVDLTNPEDSFLTIIDQDKYIFLPNTSGARNADEAIRRPIGVNFWTIGPAKKNRRTAINAEV